MAKNSRSGLGRGFDSLFADNMIESPTGSVATLPLADIEPNRSQPRKHFDDAELATLAASISELGLLQPIIVTEKIDYPGTYRIVAGERRWRASRMAGLTEIPCVIFTGDDLTRAQVSLVENIQRKDLDPVEEAAGLRDLMERFGLTQDECSARTGKSRPAVANAVRLLELPEEVLGMISDGLLSAGHGRALLGLNVKDGIVPLARKAQQTGMSVREVEKAVKLMNRPAAAPKASSGDVQKEVYFAELERKAMELSGHRIKISDLGEGKRRLTVDYSDNDDLEELLLKLCGPDVLGL